ncbi:MAG: hypothetical protein ACOX4N_00420 [Dethiobacteraceae bacterium]
MPANIRNEVKNDLGFVEVKVDNLPLEITCLYFLKDGIPLFAINKNLMDKTNDLELYISIMLHHYSLGRSLFFIKHGQKIPPVQPIKGLKIKFTMS